MKTVNLLALTLFLNCQLIWAQQKFNLRGWVKDSTHTYGIAGILVEVSKNEKTIGRGFTDDAGVFRFVLNEAPPYILKLKGSFRSERLMVVEQANDDLVIELPAEELKGEEVVITAYRPKLLQPITQTNLHRKAITELYYGADIPTLLQNTPSINAYSDAGNGIGYSFFRLRGIDQSRINFSVNGIPVNDPENQGFFFNNFADLASSASNIQVVRGVGTSANGTSAFGGALHLQTLEPQPQPGFGLESGVGSFGSSRFVTDFNTGKLNEKFAFTGRFSQLQSKGYRHHSATSIQSYYVSGAMFGLRSTLRLNAFGGSSNSELAYQAITREDLARDRRANPISNGEKDAFIQNFFQLQYDLKLNESMKLAISPYHVRGNAPKFQFTFPGVWSTPYSYFNMPPIIEGNDTNLTAGDMMVAYRLKQQLYGVFANLSLKKGKSENIVGAHANTFSSDHFMEHEWGAALPEGIRPGHLIYFNTGVKNEFSIFNKATYYLTDSWMIFGDLQWRLAQFRYSEKIMTYRPSFGSVEPMQWSFFNPKAGVRYFAAEGLSLYSSLGLTGREPTRFDYFQDDFATRERIRKDDIQSEQVTNLEAGLNFGSARLRLNANLFYMQFNNQILGSGVLNQFGIPINTNVDKSYRRGVELDFSYRPSAQWLITHHSTWMQSRIEEINQYYYDDAAQLIPVTFRNVDALLSPKIIAQQSIRYYPVSDIWVEASSRYVSRQFLDNSMNQELSIPAYWLVDARLNIQLQKYLGVTGLNLAVVCNNLLDEKYTPWGSIAPFSGILDISGKPTATPLFFPAATRNWFATLSLRL